LIRYVYALENCCGFGGNGMGEWVVDGSRTNFLKQIDKYPLHYSTPPHHALLSPSESQYCAAHTALLHRHYGTSFLSQFPQALQRMDDAAGGISMVDRPDEDRAVFVRVLRDCGTVGVEGTDVRCELKRGDVWVLRWRVVRGFVGEGGCELV
jgi:GINS complex subunit 4